ncbi:MAG: DUF4838 domain-containing protein [Lentisphaerae bacterium]|nr:DUF4838 domain-containing protein [Lentisphaerota bacterium]
MKKFFCASALLCGLSLSAELSIVLPDHPTASEKMAAQELAEHFTAATGKKYPIVKGKVSGKAIYIGTHPQAVKIAGKKKYGKEEWQLTAKDANTLAVTGGEPRGVIYAAYEFLESDLGVVWMDEWSVHVPKHKTIQWKKNLKRSGIPSFPYRSVHTYFGAPKDLYFKHMARNRMNHYHDKMVYSGPAFDRGVNSVTGYPRACHTYFNYTKDWGKAEEECFSWSQSSRKRIRAKNASGPGQVCYSNPKTVTLFTAKLKEFIALDAKTHPVGRRPEIYCIMQNDNGADCQCKECLALVKKYKGYSGALLHFINGIARNIRKDHPDIKIMTTAYINTKNPPVGIKPESNVMVEIALLGGEYSGEKRHTHRSYYHPANKDLRKLLEDWSKITTLGIWDYWILFAERWKYPATNALNIAENLRFYKKLGVQFVFAECEEPVYTSLHQLRVWLGLRLMNNLDLDEQKEIDRFMAAYYGKAAPYMRKYHDFLQKGNTALDGSLCDIPLNRRTDLNDDFFRTVLKWFDEAEKAVKDDPVILERLGKERNSIDTALLDKRAMLAKELVPDPNAIAARLKKNFDTAVKRYTYPAKQKRRLDEMVVYCQGINANVPPLKGFEDKQVIADCAWPVLTTDKMSSVLTDPEAAGGKAVGFTEGILPSRTTPSELVKRLKNDRGISLGVYDFHNRRYQAKSNLPEQKIPTDEKYHWYSLGRLTLTEKCFLWMHWSWCMQLQLRAYYDTSGLNNDVEIFVHLKVQGPNIAKGSKKPNTYAVDRVVICKAGIGGPGPVSTPLPKQYKNRKVYADLVGTTLPTWRFDKVYDVDSLYGSALNVDKRSTHSKRHFMIGMYDDINRRTAVRITPQVPQDEKYHFYSLGVRKVPKRGYIFAHSSGYLRVETKRCANFLEPDKKYEVIVSVKAQGPAYVSGSKKINAVFIDRVLLLEPEKGKKK